MSRVSIIIPVYNRMDLTRSCLMSLQETCGADIGRSIEIIVVDNGSTDGTFDAAREAGPAVTVLRSPTNTGFARGCNLGADHATGDVVVFLNNDTEAHGGWLPPLLEALEDDSVGVVAPKLLFPDGTLQHAGMMLVDDIPAGVSLSGVHRWWHGPADLPQAGVRADLQVVCGAVMAMHRDLFWRLDGFDEGYWNGCEDIDLCLAVRAAGLRVLYEPASVLTHHESSSGPQRWTKLNENLSRLATRWRSQLTPDLIIAADGAVLPGVPGVPGSPGDPPQAMVVALRGAAFGYHSLAQVNRELAVRLTRDQGMVVRTISEEIPDLGPEQDPRLETVVRSTLATQHRAPQVTIRHQWPPDFSVPGDDSPLVFIQPWEFGGLPDDWVGPLSELPDEIWCYTSWVRDCYVRSGVPADRIVVVPIGVDGTRFRPDGDRYPLRTTKAHRFLFVGGTIRRKGIDVALDAYRAAFGPNDDVCLVVKSFGSHTVYRDNNADAVLAAAAADGNGAEIELVTDDLSQAQMAALYRSCHTLVHPYRGEGFGMPIAEAMSSGLSVVVTNDGAARDFCDEGTAYLIPSRRQSLSPVQIGLSQSSRAGYWLAEPDAAALQGLLRDVVADPQEARSRAEAGRRRVAEVLDWDRIAATAAARLSTLASRPARRLDPSGGAYHPGAVPFPLAQRRGETVLIVAGPERRHWADAVAAAAGCFTGADDVTLVVAVEAAGAAHPRTLDQLSALLDRSSADVLAVLDPLGPAGLAGLIVACDGVVVTDEEMAERVRRCNGVTLTCADLVARGQSGSGRSAA